MNKIKPVSFLDTINYKIGYQLYLFIQQHVNHNHLILYGGKKSGKTLLIQSLFKELYEGEPKLTVNEHFQVYIHTNYYLFDCNLIFNKQQFIDYLKSIIETYDYYNNQSKYIIFTHFENTNEMIQNSLKVIVEKGSNTCKMIFITNKMNKIILPLQSRCTYIRIPTPSSFEKFIYLKGLFNNHSLKYNEFLLMQYCKKYDLETIVNKYNYIEDNIHIIDEYSLKIKNIIYEPVLNIQKIQAIRKLCSQCKEIDLSIQDIFKRIIDNFTGTSKEQKIIHEISKYDTYLQKSYRDLIHLESLIISLNSIMNDI